LTPAGSRVINPKYSDLNPFSIELTENYLLILAIQGDKVDVVKAKYKKTGDQEEPMEVEQI